MQRLVWRLTAFFCAAQRFTHGCEPTDHALRPTVMRIQAAVLGVTLACLTGCGTAAPNAPRASPDVAATSDQRAGSASGPASPSSPSDLVARVSAVPESTVATALPGVTPEFATACGRPGASIVVRKVPVTVKRRDCDLTGVTISLRDDGTGISVPKPGEESRGQPDVVAGYSPLAGLDIAVDAKTGDVTVSSY